MLLVAAANIFANQAQNPLTLFAASTYLQTKSKYIRGHIVDIPAGILYFLTNVGSSAQKRINLILIIFSYPNAHFTMRQAIDRP